MRRVSDSRCGEGCRFHHSHGSVELSPSASTSSVVVIPPYLLPGVEAHLRDYAAMACCSPSITVSNSSPSALYWVCYLAPEKVLAALLTRSRRDAVGRGLRGMAYRRRQQVHAAGDP